MWWRMNTHRTSFVWEDHFPTAKSLPKHGDAPWTGLPWIPAKNVKYGAENNCSCFKDETRIRGALKKICNPISAWSKICCFRYIIAKERLKLNWYFWMSSFEPNNKWKYFCTSFLPLKNRSNQIKKRNANY